MRQVEQTRAYLPSTRDCAINIGKCNYKAIGVTTKIFQVLPTNRCQQVRNVTEADTNLPACVAGNVVNNNSDTRRTSAGRKATLLVIIAATPIFLGKFNDDPAVRQIIRQHRVKKMNDSYCSPKKGLLLRP